MTDPRQRLGRWGERVAAHHLEAHGYRIVNRNYHCPHGEIDLIAQTEQILVFVEVKTRRGNSHGRPEDAVTPTKARHLIACAEHFLQTEPGMDERDWRIDVIAVQLDTEGKLISLEQIENAVTEW